MGSAPPTGLPSFTLVPLDGELAERLGSIPPAAGVAQLLGPEGMNLLIGRAANLRRWAASHLGAGRPPAKGRRPPTNLRPVATGIAHAVTTTAFLQKLAYERLMARHVPMAKRRDLKPPAFLHLDPAERFPRVAVRRGDEGTGGLFGPFRDRKAAERARDALHKLIPLRPCDYVFEPDPAWPVGVACLFAQVRSCAAPCLGRIGEVDYRELAAKAAALLGRPGPRDAGLDWLPSWVAAVPGGRGLVVDAGRERVALYPVSEGRVREDAAGEAAVSELPSAVERLRWDAAGGESDWPWLLPWIASPRGRGSYVALGEGDTPAAIVARLREVITLAVGGSSRGGA